MPGAEHRSSAAFFEDEATNFTFLIALGGAYYRAADVGTCLAIAARIEDGDPASAFEAFSNAGARLEAIADAAAAASHRISAWEAYLQAANYFGSATYFADPMGAPERFAPAWLRHRAPLRQGGGDARPAYGAGIHLLRRHDAAGLFLHGGRLG
jgi:hypothetical protein